MLKKKESLPLLICKLSSQISDILSWDIIFLQQTGSEGYHALIIKKPYFYDLQVLVQSSTCDLLTKKGITTITDLQATNSSQISDILSPDVAQKLINFSFGKDDSVVKLSGKPLSIGLEDRFKCINTKEECRKKADWLLGRLARLLLEDGRKPQTLKVFIRDFEKDKHDPKRKFVKYSRQCKVRNLSWGLQFGVSEKRRKKRTRQSITISTLEFENLTTAL